jgi:phospholipase/carboxylesterase
VLPTKTQHTSSLERAKQRTICKMGDAPEHRHPDQSEPLSLSKIVYLARLPRLSGGNPKQIIPPLHGYDSNGTDLISLAPHWQCNLPNASFLAPPAPHRFRSLAVGHWVWPLSIFRPQALATGVASAAPAIGAFTDRTLQQCGLTEENLAIVGCSQETMMA